MFKLPLKYTFGEFDEIDINKIKKILKNNTKEILIVGIGTPKLILDSVGPYICSELKEQGFNVRGTLEEPIHALNIHKFIKSTDLSKYFVIVIDACIGSNIGDTIITNTPSKPGAGARKKLPPIGDMSIKLVIANINDMNDYSIDAISKALSEDPNGLRAMFLYKIIIMFNRLQIEGLL